MNPSLNALLSEIFTDALVSAVFSGAMKADGISPADEASHTYLPALKKVRIRPLSIGGTLLFQAEEFRGTQVFHKNVTAAELIKLCEDYTGGFFKQLDITTHSEQIYVLMSKKGTVTIKRKKNVQTIKKTGDSNFTDLNFDKSDFPKLSLSHNREKNYLLKEGEPVPFLTALGVMTADGKVVKAKYDKFRQINRFLEFIADILPELPSDKELTIIDFGCGKSYLTFAVYHFLCIMNHRRVRIIGLDLKEQVIRDCDALAKKLHYDDLHFLVGDIADYTGMDKVDMVITLHACDTATDYALAKAVAWKASVILSVPCCQHEFNKTMKNDVLAPLFGYGLIKERTAALFTDAVRAKLLETVGYKTQLLEFIDMEHTPKNILLRAVAGRQNAPVQPVYDCIEALHVESTLANLLKNL